MIDDIAVTWTICWFYIGICRARMNSLYNFTLFLVFWLVHAVSWGPPPRQSIDYLLKAVSGWQQVLTLVYPPYYLVDSIKLSYVIGYKGLSACDGSLGNIMNNYTGAVLGWWCCSSSQWAGIILCLGGANGRLWYINNVDSRCPDPCKESFLKYCYIIVHKTELEFWFKWFRECITWLVTAH